jgi:dimethylaniline monooxygenase (N-oxide forming)
MRFFFHTAITPTDKTIDVAPFPSHFSSDGVAHFPITDRPESRKIQDTVVKPDIIVFATGYVPSVPFLDTSHNAGRRAYPSLHETNVRNIWKDDDPTVGFIGFVRPGFSAIPPLAELQAMLFTTHLLGRVPNKLEPEDEWHYRIITPPGARIDYGVEHDSYAYQLAKDMDIAPSVSDIFRLSLRIKDGWRLPCIWAAGASFNCKFRLTGMWKWDGAADRLTDELWETITRREEFFSNFTMSVLPLLYLGCINLLVFIYAYVWGVLVMFGLAEPLVHRNEPQRLMEELSRRHKATMMQKGDLATTAADPMIDGHSTTNHITAKVQGPTDYAHALH